jgi:putative membrane protein
MKGFLLRWLLNGIALLLVVNIVPGVRVAQWETLAVAALVLGLLNAFLRPILLLLTLPVTVLTLGLFALVVNGVIFYLASALVAGFTVTGFGSAFLGALAFSILSSLLGMVTGIER